MYRVPYDSRNRTFFSWYDDLSVSQIWSLPRLHDHTQTQKQSVELLWTNDQPVAETSTWQHTTPTRDRHPCPRWDSNPQSPASEQSQTHAYELVAYCKLLLQPQRLALCCQPASYRNSTSRPESLSVCLPFNYISWSTENLRDFSNFNL